MVQKNLEVKKNFIYHDYIVFQFLNSHKGKMSLAII